MLYKIVNLKDVKLYNLCNKGGNIMSYFSNKFDIKEEKVRKTLYIDEELYYKLEYLSQNKYDASINKLVNAAIENLFNTEQIILYNRKNKFYVSRSFLVRETLVENLYSLKDKYGISINLLINVAIRNSLLEEKTNCKTNEAHCLKY